jgi:hypothetical protein
VGRARSAVGAELCSRGGCGRPAELEVEVAGRVARLCREHYGRLLKRLESEAEKRGSASLEDIASELGARRRSSSSRRR